jgi:mRNA-degrading endonuclease RelE of RelBE toxin-antitoxin system
VVEGRKRKKDRDAMAAPKKETDAKAGRYRIEYDPETEDYLAVLTARDQAVVLDKVVEQLSYEPKTVTRNRKPMRPNRIAPWVLRLGRIRVYYEVRERLEKVVLIRAIGIKDRDRVIIGGEEVELS